MIEALKSLGATQFPTICLIVGFVFILLGAVGRLGGNFSLEFSKIKQIVFIVSGLIIVSISISLYLLTSNRKSIMSDSQELMAEKILNEKTKTEPQKLKKTDNKYNKTSTDNIPSSNLIKHSGTLKISVVDRAGRVQKIDEVFVSCANGAKPIKFEAQEYFEIAIAKSCSESYINAHTVGLDRWLVDIWHFRNKNQPLATEDYTLIVNNTKIPSSSALIYADAFANFKINLEYIKNLL